MIVAPEQIRLLANLAKVLEGGPPPERIKIDPAATAVALCAVLAERENLALLRYDMFAANPHDHANTDAQRRIDVFKQGGDVVGNG